MSISPENKKLLAYFRNYRPFSLSDYLDHGMELIKSRIETEGTPDYKSRNISKAYASKWGQLSMTSRAGFVVTIVYYIASRENLDVTVTLGRRLIGGLFGRSIGMDTAYSAFSTKGRTASDISADFSRLDEIIEKYKPWALKKHEQFVYRRSCNRDLAYELYQKQLEHKKSQKGGGSKIRKVEKKTA